MDFLQKVDITISIITILSIALTIIFLIIDNSSLTIPSAIATGCIVVVCIIVKLVKNYKRKRVAVAT